MNRPAVVQVFFAGDSPDLVELSAALRSRGLESQAGLDAPGIVGLLVMDMRAGRPAPRLEKSGDYRKRLALLENHSTLETSLARAEGIEDFVVMTHDYDAMERRLRALLPTRTKRLTDPVVSIPIPRPTQDLGAQEHWMHFSPRGALTEASQSLHRTKGGFEPLTAYEWIHADERPTFRNAVLTVMAGQEAVTCEARLAGHHQWLLWTLIFDQERGQVTATSQVIV